MYQIGQLVGCGAIVSLFVLFMTDNERVAAACVGYLQATAIVAACAMLLALGMSLCS